MIHEARSSWDQRGEDDVRDNEAGMQALVGTCQADPPTSPEPFIVVTFLTIRYRDDVMQNNDVMRFTTTVNQHLLVHFRAPVENSSLFRELNAPYLYDSPKRSVPHLSNDSVLSKRSHLRKELVRLHVFHRVLSSTTLKLTYDNRYSVTYLIKQWNLAVQLQWKQTSTELNTSAFAEPFFPTRRIATGLWDDATVTCIYTKIT